MYFWEFAKQASPFFICIWLQTFSYCTYFEIYCGNEFANKSAKISTLKTEKNLKTLKLLPVYNSNYLCTLESRLPQICE